MSRVSVQYLWTIVVVAVIQLCASQKQQQHQQRRNKTVINIIGLLPTSSELAVGAIGRGVKPAIDLALQLVNANDTFLREHELRMHLRDTKCDMAVATKQFFDTIHEKSTNAMLFGGACYEVTGPMAQISRWWNMSQLSYADTNPVLSDRTKYKNFYRTVPSDTDFNPARLALLLHYNWRRVGTIFQDASQGEARYNHAHNDLVKILEDHDVDVVKMSSFAEDTHTALQKLKDQDVRIILGNFAPFMARRVFCSAYKLELYGPKHQWIILGDYPENWWRVPDTNITCTAEQLNETLHGYLSTDVLPLTRNQAKTESGLTPNAYLKLYNARRGNEYSKYHGYAFDGVWVIAKAIHRVLMSSSPKADLMRLFSGRNINAELNSTDFKGVTGQVLFHDGDRRGEILFEQFQHGRMVKVGEYRSLHNALFMELDNRLVWRGNGSPRDRKLQVIEMQRVHVPIYSALCVLAGLGIVSALSFLFLNIYFRQHRYIKMSSPNMNNIIICGSVMIYVSVFLLGLDGGVVSADSYPLVCTSRAWVMSIGFTLSFGAMFSKTWRVHAIFTNIKLNKKVIKDYTLFLIVGILLLLDAIVLAIWQGYDPLHRAEKSLTAKLVGDIEVIPVIEFCTSTHMTIWLGTLYAYKGLLLVIGCFFAWETRQVSIPALNDSKYIGMSVYNVVILCVCGAAVSFIIKDQPNSAFIIIGLFIIFCTTITLCLVFVPKLIELRRDPKGEEKRVRATLKKTSHRDSDSSSDVHQRIKDLTDENSSYRSILDEKNRHIRELLQQLGDDPEDYNYAFKSPVHKTVLALRQPRAAEASPANVSRGSAGTDEESYSDSSAAPAWANSPEKKNRLYMSCRSSISDAGTTESIELTDVGFRSNVLRPSPMTLQQEPEQTNEPAADDDEGDESDAWGGVYLGPSDEEVELLRKQNLRLQVPSKQDHPIVHRYTGFTYLDDPTLFENSDSDLDTSCAMNSHTGTLPDQSHRTGDRSTNRAVSRTLSQVTEEDDNWDDKTLDDDNNTAPEVHPERAGSGVTVSEASTLITLGHSDYSQPVIATVHRPGDLIVKSATVPFIKHCKIQPTQQSHMPKLAAQCETSICDVMEYI